MTAHTNWPRGVSNIVVLKSFKQEDVVNDKGNTLGLVCARSVRSSSPEAEEKKALKR